MRREPLATFLIAELSATFALPLGYAVAGGSCAPPGIDCLHSGLCAAVCSTAWSQFPEATAYGAALGAEPAVLVALLLQELDRRREARSAASRPAATFALGIVGTLGTLALVVLVFPYMSGYMLALVAGFGLAIVLALGGSYLVAERFMFRGVPGESD